LKYSNKNKRIGQVPAYLLPCWLAVGADGSKAPYEFDLGVHSDVLSLLRGNLYALGYGQLFGKKEPNSRGINHDDNPDDDRDSHILGH
jgi:hypothetical protein